jgi:hypothetical protein
MHMPTMISIHKHPESAIATLFPIMGILYGPSVCYCFIMILHTNMHRSILIIEFYYPQLIHEAHRLAWLTDNTIIKSHSN